MLLALTACCLSYVVLPRVVLIFAARQSSFFLLEQLHLGSPTIYHSKLWINCWRLKDANRQVIVQFLNGPTVLPTFT